MIQQTLIAILFFVNTTAAAAVTEFEDFGEWQAAARAYTTIGFNEIPAFAIVTTQYADAGVTFVDGLYQTIGPSFFGTYPQDGTGFDGNGPVRLLFAQPITSIAAHFPGVLTYDLYSNGELIYTSSLFFTSESPAIDVFGGLTSTQPFDEVLLYRPFDSPVFLDNLYFGPSIPGPGALPLMALGLFCNRRRHR